MHVVLDRRHLEMQPGRDLLVRQPLVEQKRDLELPRRQRLLRPRARPLGSQPGHPPQQGAGRLRRDDELPLRGPPDRRDQIGKRLLSGGFDMVSNARIYV